MGKNLYILAATLFTFSLITFCVSYTSVAPSTGDRALWHMMGLVLLLVSLVVTMAGMLTSLFEQAERRTEERERRERRDRR
jgi:hypothetical protein